MPWSVPEPSSYPSTIEATTDLTGSYDTGTQCYDGDSPCPPIAWCFGVTLDGGGEHACLRHLGLGGIYFGGGAYPDGYRGGRIWVR
jgi:hypothetical protein